MQTVLFHDTIFGPIHSRRLGTSLGINLSPNDGKTCTFDCLYCEAGFNAQGPGTTGLPDPLRLEQELEAKLRRMKDAGQPLDVITFSGNGEPTLHPQFDTIIDSVIRLRDLYYPNVKISVLSNSTRLADPKVAAALNRVDNNILKLDSAVEGTMQLLDRPTQPTFSVIKAIQDISRFAGSAIIQTMFTRGTHNGKAFDNTTPREINALIEAYRTIRPKSIMIYSIDRRTPEQSLQKIPAAVLQDIACQINQATGIPVTTA